VSPLRQSLVAMLPAVLHAHDVFASAAATPAAVPDQHRWLTFAVFAAVIGLTMMVTYIAAKRVRTPADFYTAGGGISGIQNGWAIAGDYLSAASFLGIAGLISLYGYDGFMYSVGWLVAYITVLLVIAEPCRNIGKYTLADILAYRNNPKATRIVGALSVITVSTFYLTAQMVGGGVLVKTLIGIDYEISVLAVGVVDAGLCDCLAAWWQPPGCRSSRRCCWWPPRLCHGDHAVWSQYGFSSAIFRIRWWVMPKFRRVSLACWATRPRE
jgi:hypothetical protein